MKQNAEEGTIVISEIQTQGRGRKQRSWSSPAGGIWLSIILKPPLQINKAMIITMAASIAVRNAIKEITNLSPTIKWPNDLLCNGKKICGILTELDAEIDTINHLILGIGINVNNTIDPELTHCATSLQQEAQKKISIVDLIKHLLTNFDTLYQNIQRKEYQTIRNQWLENTDTIGRTVRIDSGTNIIEGTALGITEEGHLIIETNTGKTRILSGDIEYIN